MIMRQQWARTLVSAVATAAMVTGGASASADRLDLAKFPAGRFLEDVSDYPYDLSEFSLRFEKCQYVKMFEDELAGDEDNDSPLAMKHFVVFRLCQNDSCDTCDTTYGKYVLDVETYLEYTIDYQRQAFEDMCENCDERCNDNGEYCSGCGKICYNYENLENNGYVDASEYTECQKVDYGDDDGQSFYIGPMCGSNGQKITIGLFTDENCWEPYSGDLEPSDVLGAQISNIMLSHASTTDDDDDGKVCLSCKESAENENDQNQADGDYVNEMCEGIYSASAKCESKTGLENGFIQTNREDNDYENQVENEFMACTFIDSLLWNSYTETGEIDIDSDQDEIIRVATPMQKGVLSILSLSLVGLVASIVYLHRKIEGEYPNLNFMCHPTAQLT